MSFNYGGGGPAYNPANDSLFIVNHDQYQLTAEISIPPLVSSANLNALNTATILQPLTDATNGLINQTGSNHNNIGGQMVYQGRLYGTAFVYYDATASQVVSHWVRPSTSLTSGTAQGLYQIGNWAGIVSGYLAPIPPEWQSSFGGPALTGNCCLSIISRTSYGPAVSVFDPADLGRKIPVPSTPVLYYDRYHTTLGPWDGTWNGTTDLFNGTTGNGLLTHTGMVFPDGTRSILFFAEQGIGPWCYGEGTSNQSLAGLPTPDGSTYCYDPDRTSGKGVHAYPYVAQVWAYDANDLVAVKNGLKQPWQPTPYAVWSVSLPFNSSTVIGATWDAATRRLFVSQAFADGVNPVIHVFKVAQGSSPRLTAPPAMPTNLQVQ
jgi:hypothetical protein